MNFVEPEVKQHLNQFISFDIDNAIKSGMQTFIHAVGSINMMNIEDKGKGLLDTVFINVENQAIVSGIKTYARKHYIFDFVWGIPKDSVIIVDEKPGILDTFDSVFKSLHGYILCAEVTIDKIPYKLIFDYASMIFAVDLSTGIPLTLHKFTILRKKKHQLDTQECWKDVNELKFNIMGTSLTVKQFLLTKYLLEYVKLIKIYHLDLKKR